MLGTRDRSTVPDERVELSWRARPRDAWALLAHDRQLGWVLGAVLVVALVPFARPAWPVATTLAAFDLLWLPLVARRRSRILMAVRHVLAASSLDGERRLVVDRDRLARVRDAETTTVPRAALDGIVSLPLGGLMLWVSEHEGRRWWRVPHRAVRGRRTELLSLLVAGRSHAVRRLARSVPRGVVTALVSAVVVLTLSGWLYATAEQPDIEVAEGATTPVSAITLTFDGAVDRSELVVGALDWTARTSGESTSVSQPSSWTWRGDDTVSLVLDIGRGPQERLWEFIDHVDEHTSTPMTTVHVE